MGEFRIGRKNAQHFYPDTPRGGSGALAFARNFAMGPGNLTPVATAVDGGTQIPWDFIESGAPLSVNAPITPRVTGRILFSGVVVVKNSTLTPVTVTVQVQVNGSTLLVPLVQETVDASGFAALPFEILSEALFAIGVTRNIQVFVTASASNSVNLDVDSSTIEIQEMPFAG